MAAGVLAALLVAAGCGGESGAGSDDGGQASAEATATEAEPTEGPTEESTGGSDGGELDQQTLVPTITDAMLAAGSVAIDAAVEAGGQSFTIKGSQEIGKSAKDSAIDVALSGQGVDGRLILVDAVLYLNLGQPTGDKFVRVDLTKGGPGTEMFDQLLRSTDTSASVRALQGAIKKLEVVGTEPVGGVETTHYRLTVNTNKALKSQQLPPGQVQQLPKTLTYDLWVDEDDLLRKMTTEVAGAAVTFTLSDWGEPVDITAPPKPKISKQDPFTAQS
ncbi:hypothetical protein BH20ACT6_BH20ACT6_22780 [soil metagenome]